MSQAAKKSEELPKSRKNQEKSPEKSTEGNYIEVRRKEKARRMENTMKEEAPKQESRNGKLRRLWKELRRSKMYLAENCVGWKELDGKSTRRLEKEEKKIKSELTRKKNLKFGKAGNRKLTRMEEMLLTNNTKKLMEIEEVKKNMLLDPRIPTGRKNEDGWKGRKDVKMKIQFKKIDTEEGKHWDNLATTLGMIEESETWLDAGWLETSSLEEQRCILYGCTDTDTDNDTANKTCDTRRESMENEDSMTEKRVYMLAGLFQRDGKEKVELLRRSTDATALLSRHDVEREQKDAEESCIWKNVEEDKNSSRVDKHDMVEDFILLRQEDNGPSPAIIRRNQSTSTSLTIKFGRQESARISTVTQAFKTVKDDRSSNIPLRNKIEMHEPRLATLTAVTKSEMRCQERSPGGGKISKMKIKNKSGTPTKSKVNAMKKLFEQDQVTGGNIELLSKANFNLNPGVTRSRTSQKESICAGQPGRGIQTGPRQPCGDGFRPESDWLSQPGLGGTNQSTGVYQGQLWGGAEK